jgi:hypothetical protein
MIELLVYFAVLAIVLILVFYVLQQIPLPEPINKIVMIIVVVIAGIVLISLLLSLSGTGPPLRLPR